MCQHHTGSSAGLDFVAFCAELRLSLEASALLDPPLAAAAELLQRRLTWFECEMTQVAWNAEDMHSSLGARVVLSLWNGAKAGHLSLPPGESG